MKKNYAVTPARRTPAGRNPMTRVLARMARDGEIETVAEFIDELLQPADGSGAQAVLTVAPAPESAGEPQEGAPAESAPGEEAESALDADPEILSRLDRIIELLESRLPEKALDEAAEEMPQAAETAAAAAPEADPVEAAAEEALEELGSLLVSGGEEEAVSAILEAGEPQPPAAPAEPDEAEREAESRAADRMVRAAVRALKPVIARLPREQQKSAADAAMKALVRTGGAARPAGRNAYAALAGAARQEDPAELGRRIIRSRNVNYRA